MLADNYRGVVKVLHDDGILKSPVSFKSVYDITVINENNVAVSNPSLQTISIINVDSSKVIKVICQTKTDVRVISHSSSHIYFCVSGKGVMKIIIDSEK